MSLVFSWHFVHHKILLFDDMLKGMKQNGLRIEITFDVSIVFHFGSLYVLLD